MNISAAIFAALYQRELTGQGQFVTCSLYGGGVWANGFAIQGALATGENFPRTDRYSAFNPLYNSYQAADGKWMQLAMIQEERFWGPFAEVIEQPILTEDDRFAEVSNRRKHIREAVETIERRIAEEPRDHWASLFDANDFPWAPAADSGRLRGSPGGSQRLYRTMEHKTAANSRFSACHSSSSTRRRTILQRARVGRHTNWFWKSWATTGQERRNDKPA